MKQISCILILPLVALAQPGVDERELRPRDFQYRSLIEIREPADYAAIAVQRGFYEHTANRLNDLRIFGPDGREVPWLVGESRAFVPRDPLRPPILDRVRTATGALQFVVDFGASPPVHNRLTIETSATDFRSKVRIESSDDRRAWDFVRDAVLLRFDQDGRRLEALTVEYPDSTRRYLRLRVENWPHLGTLSAVVSELAAVNEQDWEQLGTATPKVFTLKEDRATQLDVQFPFDWLDDARLTLESNSTGFSRSATVSYSTDGKSWSLANNFTIYRVGNAEQLFAHTGSISTRHLRFVIYNRDDAPISVERVWLDVPVRRVVFPAPKPGQYALYIGNAMARYPQYDLAAVLERRGKVEPILQSLTAWESNPQYVAPPLPEKPFSERFPYVLPFVLGVVVVTMGYQAFRLMRKAS